MSTSKDAYYHSYNRALAQNIQDMQNKWDPAMLRNLSLIQAASDKNRKKELMKRQELAAGILAITKNPKPKARAQINRLYELVGFKIPPKIIWYDSPRELLQAKDILNQQQNYPKNALAFKHLISFALSERRNNNGWGSSRRENSTQERAIDHIFAMVERDLTIAPDRSNLLRISRNSRAVDMAIASFKYGVSWTQMNRGAESDNDWTEIEPILEKLAQTTTGFMLSADTAHVVLPPTKISLNDSNVLDNDEGKALEWANGEGIYALRGVVFSEPMWQKLVKHEMDTGEALGLVDVDQRRVAISYLKPERMIQALKAKLVDEGKERHYHYAGRQITRVDGSTKVKEATDITIRNRLYRTMFFANPPNTVRDWRMEDLITTRSFNHTNSSNRPAESEARYFLHYNDPSTGEDYISFATQGVREHGKDADAVMGWKHHCTKEEYLNLYLEA